MTGSSEFGGLGVVARLRSVVEESTACALPGVSIKYDSFIPCMWQAVARGFVPRWRPWALAAGDCGQEHGGYGYSERGR